MHGVYAVQTNQPPGRTLCPCSALHPTSHQRCSSAAGGKRMRHHIIASGVGVTMRFGPQQACSNSSAAESRTSVTSTCDAAALFNRHTTRSLLTSAQRTSAEAHLPAASQRVRSWRRCRCQSGCRQCGSAPPGQPQNSRTPAGRNTAALPANTGH